MIYWSYLIFQRSNKNLKMATAEMAAMLDELMGRNRNANPHDKVNTFRNCRNLIVLTYKTKII